ncbi:MAG: class I SAM-dependent methyltransferase [Candidatus Schekmanbacteria bacterium]|nr:MAG: class I SAM-dependent methyltransferase [Candidatus Schekmanbacteria bacterium]
MNEKKRVQRIDSEFRFSADAPEYDSLIEKVSPYYNTLIEETIRAIPFDKDKKLNALEIGIGTGRVTEKFIEKYKNAHITGVDISEEMINVAKKKFSNRKNAFSFLIQKIEDLNLKENYDCIYSCLALHHLKDEKLKFQCYKKIFDALDDGGFFANGDLIAGENEEENFFFRENYKMFLKKNLEREEEVEFWMRRHLENDYPAPLTKHLELLNKAGFRKVQVYWKKMNYAVFGAVK